MERVEADKDEIKKCQFKNVWHSVSYYKGSSSLSYCGFPFVSEFPISSDINTLSLRCMSLNNATGLDGLTARLIPTAIALLDLQKAFNTRDQTLLLKAK